MLACHLAWSSSTKSIYRLRLCCNSSTKRDRSLRDIKRGEVPRLTIVLCRHFSTSCAECPSSSMPKARIWLVQNQWNVFPACRLLVWVCWGSPLAHDSKTHCGRARSRIYQTHTRWKQRNNFPLDHSLFFPWDQFVFFSLVREKRDSLVEILDFSTLLMYTFWSQ